ncbi:MAG: NADPH-dependent F420 reductase [Deltaproteobacteria bacterium]|nr:NADPH-dependent F420 reductase [Deltaproteobacteria bacterium]
MEEQISVAIVGGTGNLGTALAQRLAFPGVKVLVGSRDKEKGRAVADSLTRSLGKGTFEGASNRDAARVADLVVIAVPYEGHAPMLTELKAELQDKTIVDAVVPLNKGKPFTPPAGSALLEAQSILGQETRLVGALHNISAVDLQHPGAPLGDVLVCGDHADSKKSVIEFLGKIGAQGLDAGPASNAYVIEGLTGVLIQINRKYKSKHASIKITGIGER